MALTKLRLASASSPGRRDLQEDVYYYRRIAGGALLAVADGMGGHAAGEVAGRIAIESLARCARDPELAKNPARLLDQAAREANHAVLDYARLHPESDGLGATLVAAIVNEQGAVVGHAGDSRAWLISPGSVTQQTHDHSAVQEAMDEGRIDAAEAARSPFRHAILRNIGDPDFPGLELSSGVLEIPPGSVLLLTSDGAHEQLAPADYLQQLAGTPTLERALDNLMRLAFQRGSDDNITLVGCEVGRYPRADLPVQAPPPIGQPRSAPLSRPTRPPRLGIVLLALTFLITIALAVQLVRTVRSQRQVPMQRIQDTAVTTRDGTGDPDAEPTRAAAPTPAPEQDRNGPAGPRGEIRPEKGRKETPLSRRGPTPATAIPLKGNGLAVQSQSPRTASPSVTTIHLHVVMDIPAASFSPVAPRATRGDPEPAPAATNAHRIRRPQAGAPCQHRPGGRIMPRIGSVV